MYMYMYMYWSPPGNAEKVIKHVFSRTIKHIIMASQSIKGGHVMFLGSHHGQTSKYLVVLVAEMHEKWLMADGLLSLLNCGIIRTDRGSVVTLSKNFRC